ncbi:MAG: SDR family oxidoreductase [Kiritimatiellia bacterium]|nr:SDR family oxidoreductase [Kiritimatiellia bacterium]
MNLKDKVILITGAAVRIGRALAEDFAVQGCRLALHCNHSAAEAETLARRLRRQKAKVCVIKRDLTEPQASEDIIRQTVNAFGRLDAVINNAAIFSKEKLIKSAEESIRGMLEINLMAPVLITRAFAKIIGKGKIINILDRRVAGFESGMAVYLLSKKALADFTKIAALELAPDITVNGVAPGPVLAPAKGGGHDKAGKIPLGKRPTTDAVVKAVVFLLKADAITGEIIFVDGGQHLLGQQD